MATRKAAATPATPPANPKVGRGIGRGTHGRPTAPAKVDYDLKVARAMAMRIEGATFQQIADKLNFTSRQHAWKAVRDALAQIKAEPLAELRQVELERLDRMYLALSVGRRKGDLGAINTSIRISERRAKLAGLDDYESRMAAVEEQRVALEAAEADRLFAAMVRALQRLGLSSDQLARFTPLLLEEMAVAEMAIPELSDTPAQLELPAPNADPKEPDDGPPEAGE